VEKDSKSIFCNNGIGSLEGDMSLKGLLGAMLLLSAGQIHGAINLDQLMLPADQKRTGVANLNPEQKYALADWIDQHFIIKTAGQSRSLSLALNVNGGKKLLLSDHSLYEISPDDVALASAWLSPSLVDIIPSGDAQYPDRIVNKDTGTSVKARKVSSSSTP
jgi:hypothetical protein